VQSPKCRWLKAIARGFIALLIALCLAPLLLGETISRAVISARLTGWLFPDAWIMVPALAGTVLIITRRWITACGDPHP
jgi:hypothetical protein